VAINFRVQNKNMKTRVLFTSLFNIQRFQCHILPYIDFAANNKPTKYFRSKREKH